MNILDWLVIVLYLAVIVGIAVYLTRSQRNTHDYYLAGRRLKWWQSGASTMATQLGAISFVSAPAFVAIKDGGGLKWLCYEFSVPLALILVMAVVIPSLHRRSYVSIYEYLEERFDAGTRSLVSFSSRSAAAWLRRFLCWRVVSFCRRLYPFLRWLPSC